MASPNEKIGQSSSSTVARDGGNTDLNRQAEALALLTELQDEMNWVAKKISQHEENINYLKTIKSSFTKSIAEMQDTLTKHRSSSTRMTKEKDLSQKRMLEDTAERIMQHEKTAASVVCHLARNVANESYARTAIGVLATLGHVDNTNLSRLLSEYLGLDTMLAIVCKSHEYITSMETYDEEGSINKETGLYWRGACAGKVIDGRLKVICLQDLRPYVGEFMPDDPQRRLAILEPKLPDGESPAGFLGFAVNMIYIDSEYLSYVTDDGYGLRETLFYSLFSRLQVYRTRTDMMRALPSISDGAISLDGGIIRSPGVFILGNRGETDVNFGIWCGASFYSKEYVETEKELKELQWKSDRMSEDLKREATLLMHARTKFEVKKKEFLEVIAQRLR